MLGYVMPEKPELKIKEYEIYKGYYCGICKSIGRRYGQLQRLTLSYDSVFLALILSGLKSDVETIKETRCMLNPMKKRNIVFESDAVDYAADLMLILAYFKLKDDYADEKKILAGLGSAFMRRTFLKLIRARGEKCEAAENRIAELAKLEQEGLGSIDPAAEPFARLMEEIFDGGDMFWAHLENAEEIRLICRKIGYHLGKWIYLVDAFDDVEDNVKSGAYNPLLYQFKYDPSKQETVWEFKERIKDRIQFNLIRYLAEIAEAYEHLEIKKNNGLIENIIYFGLRKKTEDLLKNENKINKSPIKDI